MPQEIGLGDDPRVGGGRSNLPRDISCVKVLDGRKQRFEGSEKVILTDLLEFIKVHDPDVILLPYADTWVPLIVEKARRYGLEPTFSRSGWFKQMASESFCSGIFNTGLWREIH